MTDEVSNHHICDEEKLFRGIYKRFVDNGILNAQTMSLRLLSNGLENGISADIAAYYENSRERYLEKILELRSDYIGVIGFTAGGIRAVAVEGILAKLDVIQENSRLGKLRGGFCCVPLDNHAALAV